MVLRAHRGLWPAAIAAYPAVGVLAGCGLMDGAISAAGLRPGMATALAINVVMPMAAVALALLHPRISTALCGAALMMAGFVLTRLVIGDPAIASWTWSYVKATTHPIELVAMIGYALIGAGTVFAVRPWRRLRLPDQDLRCLGCDYLLTGADASAPCPECGRPRA